MYQTVREVNADASVWGGELLAGGFGFATALHTGFSDANGGGVPSAQSVVVTMDGDLLVGTFVPQPKPQPKPKPQPQPKPKPKPKPKPNLNPNPNQVSLCRRTAAPRSPPRK